MLFLTDRGQPFNNWSNAKRAFDTRCPIAPRTLHDLHWTFATGLASLGVAPHVTERFLAHSTGQIAGVAAIYNRHQYMDEMRKALTLWEGYLARLLKQYP